MPDFVYQTVQVRNRMPFRGVPSPRGEAVGAGVELAHKALVALNGWAVSQRVNREIGARSAEIKRLMPVRGGVLLCVGTQEWATPDPSGTRAQSFLSLHIVGGGNNPTRLLRRYLMQSQLVQGSPKGWQRRDSFVWVTC